MEQEIYLTPRQMNIVRIVEKGPAGLDEIAEKLNTRYEDLMRDVTELVKRGLIEDKRETITVVALTREGEEYLKRGFPEERALSSLAECKAHELGALRTCIEDRAGLSAEEASIAIQYLVKSGCLRLSGGKIAGVSDEKCSELLRDVNELKEELRSIKGDPQYRPARLADLKRRRLVEEKKRTIIRIFPTGVLTRLLSEGRIREREILTVVKPQHAVALEKYVIKEFDLTVEPPSLPISRKHPFMEFIDDLREIMVSMGFEEVKGPHVEAEFWNFDALFQAQDHPAREIHDTFFVSNNYLAKVPGYLLERARAIHEEGWRYRWSPERAMRLVLRSQTTAVSARTIFEKGEGEYRAFTIDRNFRPENLDAKHSMEFYQLDGIIVGKDVNFRHLLYFFKELAAALGIREVWFKPGYFPFTEPSVEGYIRHPKLGWIEVFPGGVFRPEVMNILGAPGVRAIAWGIGVDRLAMAVMGVDDIRKLFARDIDELASIRYLGLPYFYTRVSGKHVQVKSIPD